MRGTTGICAALLCLAAAPARAADEDTQLWLYGNLVLPVAPDTAATLEVSPRLRDNGDQWLFLASADYKASDRVSLGGALAYLAFDGGHEFRLHQQAVITLGPIALRSRAEERWFAGADRMQLRLRQRIAASVPLAQDTRATLAGELLYIARPETAGTAAHVDSWRAQAMVQHKLSAHFDAGAGYLLVYTPRPGAPDRISHVPQLTLTWRP